MRLQTIYSLIPQTAVIADIGCDHGKVSEYIVKNDLCKRLIVNDISAPSLEKARRLLDGYSPSQTAVEFVCADGAALTGYGIGCAVIAGLGGREMLKVLEALTPAYAVLAPQNYADGVRGALWELGYGADADIPVIENGKYYDILRVASGQRRAAPPDAFERAYGYGCRSQNAVLKAKLLRDEQNLLSYKQTPENLQKLQIVREVLEWQR